SLGILKAAVLGAAVKQKMRDLGFMRKKPAQAAKSRAALRDRAVADHMPEVHVIGEIIEGDG
ncbi:unnamed protein product, partial [Chrysoparadoxa australica]